MVWRWIHPAEAGQRRRHTECGRTIQCGRTTGNPKSQGIEDRKVLRRRLKSGIRSKWRRTRLGRVEQENLGVEPNLHAPIISCHILAHIPSAPSIAGADEDDDELHDDGPAKRL